MGMMSQSLVPEKPCDQIAVRYWTNHTISINGISDQILIFSSGLDSSNRLYATGQMVIGGVQRLVTIKSLDDAKSWIKIDEVVATSAVDDFSTYGYRLTVGPNGALYVVGAVDDRWVIRKSTDFGITWATLDNFRPAPALGSGAYGLLVTPSAIIAFGNVRVSSTESRWQVRRSADAGSTWTTVDDFSIEVGQSSSPSEAIIDKNGHIYIVGGGRLGNFYAWAIRKSTDGGTTWVSVGGNFQQDPNGHAYANGVIAHGPSGAILVSGYSTDAAGGRYAIVRRTLNGGTTWTTVDSTSASNGGQLLPDHSGNVYFSASVGGNGVVRRTMDGGSTWDQFDSFKLAPSVATMFFHILSSPAGGFYITAHSGQSPGPTQAFMRKLEPSHASKISETCLYKDMSNEIVDSRVQEYTPQYALWSDGAAKRRWIYLPENSKIDSTDMDGWSFPVGTKLWKEFKVAGKKIETRLLSKVRDGKGPQFWDYAVYKWNEEQTEAVLTLAGDIDVLGTPHDIPNSNTCVRCHQGGSDFVLGFEAIQLSFVSQPSHLNMDRLRDQDRLTSLPTAEFKIAGSAVDRAALGYLHVNCGSCHSPRGSVPNAVGLNFRHSLGTTSVTEENAYATTVGRMGYTKTLIAPGNPAGSRVLDRMVIRGTDVQMPPSMTEVIDPVGIQTMTDWINGL